MEDEAALKINTDVNQRVKGSWCYNETLMEDEAALKIKRQKALTAVSASMAVIIQVYDLALSAEIIADATEKYGKELIDDLMSELIESGYVSDVSTLPNDILQQRAWLNMIKPLPLTWMKTRN